MKQIYRITCCAAAVLALGGCKSFVNALGFGPKADTQIEQRAEIFGSEELQNGKLALQQGHVAAAIQQFRLAALNEDHAADAFNGLGVAYARLGRADLAERYFQAAIKVDPGNPKYAANLTRFYQSPLGNSARALAMRAKETQELLAQAERTAIAEGLIKPEVIDQGTIALTTPSLQIERISDSAVAIAKKEIEPVSHPLRRQAEIRINTKPDSADKANSAISLVGQVEEPAKPRRARITVSRSGPRWSGRPQTRKPSYPVRISLRRNTED